jgi:hypothetical protein
MEIRKTADAAHDRKAKSIGICFTQEFSFNPVRSYLKGAERGYLALVLAVFQASTR